MYLVSEGGSLFRVVAWLGACKGGRGIGNRCFIL